MDGISVLIGVAVFFISALMIYFISAFSMREKTFEEAMEEQRKRQEEEREKAKAEKRAEKEQHKKKYPKKMKPEKFKEKSATPVTVEQIEHRMVNLEIEPEIIEPTESLGLGSSLRQRGGKKEKAAKSILHNRDEVAPVAEKVVEVRHKGTAPKDEIELKKASDKVEKVEKTKVSHTEAVPTIKEKTRQEGKDKSKHTSEIKENLPPKKSDETLKEKSSKHGTDEADKRTSRGKASDDVPLNGARLISSIKTAKLSESEVQTLIEILLNRQGLTSGVPDFPVESWNKKSQKGDPVLLLKKQLEEKERALQEEQSLAMSANSRVKELRQELATERGKNAAQERQFEEKLAHQQSEVEALHQRMHHSHEQHMHETSNLQGRIRQLEQGGDRAALQKLTDDNKTLQDALNLKAQETVKLNESAKNLEKQLSASVAQVQNIEINKKAVEAKAKGYEEKLRQLEAAQKDIDTVINKRVEEVGSELTKSEAKNAQLVSDLQNATSALNTAQGEVSTLKGKLHELEEHLSRADSNKEFERKCSDLEGNVKNLNKQLNDVSQRLKEREMENQRLQQENKTLADENKTISEKLQSAPASNGDIHGENGPSLPVEEHERLLAAKAAELTELNSHFESQKKVTSNMQVQLDTKSAELEDLKQQLSQQKVKNNELREKNWKAMEALSETEKSSAEKVEKALKSAREIGSQASAEVEKYDKAVLLRLFPGVQVSDKLSHKEWISTFEKQAVKKLSSADASNKIQEENNKLQTQLSASEKRVDELTTKADKLAALEKEFTQLQSSVSSQSDSEKYSQLEKANSRLTSEVDKYKSIVSETESKVRDLERSIDAREKDWQQKLHKAETSSSQSSESSQRISQLETLVTEQENQMQEYRKFLSHTEHSLKEVEGKVASQEKSWQEKLSSSQSELAKTKHELSSLKQELLDSKGSQEMTDKVERLETELKESQMKVLILTKEKEKVTTNVTELESRLSATITVDNEKDLSEFRSQLEKEKKKNKELSLNVVKLNGIIKTGQDALSQEQSLVKKLQEQLDSKSVNSGMTEADEVNQATPNTDNGTSV